MKQHYIMQCNGLAAILFNLFFNLFPTLSFSENPQFLELLRNKK